ncbi:MAG TPA: T9SS type A sorting domain-containing protein, partial [Cytophagaceae bacterium]
YCNYVENIVISQPPLLKVVGINSPTFNTYNIKCNGGDDGSMSIVATGGTVPYTYFIGRGAIEFSNSTGSFSNLEAGTYTVEVRDKVGCYATSTKVMYQPAKFNVSFYPEDIKCNGNNDGRIMANPSGGLTPYGFSVNNGASFVNNQIISGLSPGTYLCIAKDANGCLVKDTLVLSEPEKLILSVTEVQDVSCFAGIDGAISLTASGGKGNLKYGINEGTFQESPVFTDLPAGEQVVKVQDANNCITSDTVLILQPEQLVINFHVAHVQCTGFNNGIVRAEVSGGIAPYTYNWQGLQDTDSIIEGLEPGTYKLSIRDAHQCPFSQTIEVTEPEDVLSAVISYKKDAHCNANCTGIAEVEVSGGTAPYSYFWNDKDSTNSFRADSLCKGTYLVKILDSRNCVASESVTINDSIHYSINIPPQTILCPGQTVTMKTDLTGVFHQWYKGSTLLSYNSSILLNEEGNYHVYVKDRHDCYQNASFYIKTSNELLDAKFLLSSFEELGDTIVLTEISWPRPDSVHWSFGNSPIILSNDPIQPVLYYPNEGTFNIKLTAYLGECIDSVQKNVTFFVAPANSPEDTTVLGVNKIKELKLYPNPNNGQFTLEVKLDQEDIVNLSIYTSQGNEVSSLKNWGKDDYKFYYNLPRNPGIYMLKVTTTTDYKSLIFVVE